MDRQERKSSRQAAELSLELKLQCGSPAPSPFHNGVRPAASEEQRATDLEEFARKLLQERQKLEVFQRELPLSLILLNDVIGDLEEEIARRRNDLPAAEKKQRLEEESGGAAVDHGGAMDSSPPQRRWSAELRESLVNALMTLGGLKAATPKKVNDLMKVEGLTNEEIKSHSQKFRLGALGFTPSLPAPLNRAVAGGPFEARGITVASERKRERQSIRIQDQAGFQKAAAGPHKPYAENQACDGPAVRAAKAGSAD